MRFSRLMAWFVMIALSICAAIGYILYIKGFVDKENADTGIGAKEKPKLLFESLPSEVVVKKEAIQDPSSVASVDVLTILSLGKALDCERATSAAGLEVILSRPAHKLSASVWTRRGKKAVHVDGFDNVGRLDYKVSAIAGDSPAVSAAADLQPTTFMAVTISRRGANAQEGKSLLLVSNNNRKEIPFDGYMTGDCIFSSSYPIALIVKLSGEKSSPKRVSSLLIVNTLKLEVTLEVPVPAEVETSNVFFVLSPKCNAVLAVDQNLNWLKVIDMTNLVAR